MKAIDPANAAHTFAVPDLGVSVPLLGRRRNAPGEHRQDRLQLQGPGLRDLPLAVLRPLRSGDAVRQRRPDADPGLHGRPDRGGVVSRPAACCSASASSGSCWWPIGTVIIALLPFPPARLHVGQEHPDTIAADHLAGLADLHPGDRRAGRHASCSGADPEPPGVDRPDPRQSAPRRAWIGVVRLIVLSPGDLRHRHPVQRGRRGGARPRWPRHHRATATPAAARRPTARGAGDRPAVAVHLPLPGVRRLRDRAPGAPGNQKIDFPRHLAGRDPLFWFPALGVKADAVPRNDNV